MSVDAVIDEVMRDAAYFTRSGGGVTISGGEPMAQFEFCYALLSEARRRGLHTCLDTSGAASLEKFREIAPQVDLFLFDYKATESKRHRELTGTANRAILRNLQQLYDLGARIRLRCPLVPGVNDSPEHLAGIARLEATYPHLESIEILPYHALGRDKAARIGHTYALPHVPSADEAMQAVWVERLDALGSSRSVVG